MPLASGTRFGPYEILGTLGIGGMGEVYHARDTRLDRSVALKVLPPGTAADPQARARFEREARVIAALDHPHICSLYDVGDSDGTHYLVMPLLEGQTLAARLERGALTVDVALAIAIQVADALDKAHRQGIVHRDLKPGNVMLTKSGVKLLDFGLAKLRGRQGPISLSGMGQLATTTPATAEGIIVGTVPYMAPEQVEGKEADPRSDLWALGAVLYEMLTGTRAFQGDSAASVIGAILKDVVPPVTQRQPHAPCALDHVLSRCLEKEPDERWQTAADLKRELQWVQSAPAQKPASTSVRPSLLAFLLVVLAAAWLVVITLTGPAWLAHNGERPPEVLQLSVLPPRDTFFSSPPSSIVAPQVAISPDGQLLAFVAQGGRARPGLWVRNLREPTARMLPGTDDATYPFWSPDSASLGFFARGRLMTIDVAAGPPRVLTAAALDARGGTWGRDGTIVFSRLEREGLFRIPSNGGQATPVTRLDPARGEVSHRFPSFLPDGRHFLFAARTANQEQWGVSIGSVEGAQSRPLIERTAWGAHYSPPGYILFARNGTLMAQPFDAERLLTTGQAISVAEDVGATPTGSVAFSASLTGVLVHAPPLKAPGQLRWVDRTGRVLAEVGNAAELIDFELSPDERTLALSRLDDPKLATADIWLMDLTRSTFSRLTTDPLNDAAPLWSPDGTQLTFRSNRGGRSALYTKRVVGTEPERLVFEPGSSSSPTQWSADGRWILYSAAMSATGFEIWAWPIDGSGNAQPAVKTALNATHGRLSPDGRWLAYASDELGEWQIYVQRFPSTGERWPVSSGVGGSEPRWRRDGKELFYLSADNKMMAVPVTLGPSLQSGSPQPLFDVAVPILGNPYRSNYTVSGDGRRFLINSRLEIAPPAVNVIVNWPLLLGPTRVR